MLLQHFATSYKYTYTPFFAIIGVQNGYECVLLCPLLPYEEEGEDDIAGTAGQPDGKE